MRVPFADLHHHLTCALCALGLSPDRASLSARLIAEATRDGVYTHGLNRFPRFVAAIRSGLVDVSATSSLVAGHGALERWHGNSGIGNLNAFASIERAITLARSYGLGAVALSHTNHWMRAGTYGWHAADQGLFAICWTNTMPNLPAWGTTAATLGNNPLVLAVPRRTPEGNYAGGPHVVLDMALSQFSYGQLDAYSKRGEPLPVPGGYDRDGELTTDPAATTETLRALPVGFWKGSGLALTLDLFAALLSGGNATHQIPPDPTRETGLSQFFLAIDPSHLSAATELDRAATALIDQLHSAPCVDLDQTPRYPGENTLHLREINLREGVPVEDPAWSELLSLST